MSEVTRFDLVTKGRGFDTWQKMEADPDGEWVKAEDYAAMAEHAAMAEMQRDALRAEVERLTREVHFLRLYGNKDCTAMADEAMARDADPTTAQCSHATVIVVGDQETCQDCGRVRRRTTIRTGDSRDG